MWRIEDKFTRIAIVFVVVICLSALYKWVSSYFLVANVADNVSIEYYSQALKKYSFAGEPLPFNELKMIKRYQSEIVSNANQSAEMVIMIKKARIWLPRMEQVFQKHGLPTDFKYLAAAESYFSNNISPMHAAGFWQIQKTTGITLGLVINDEIDERFNPLVATEAVCRYIKRTKKQFPTWTWTDIAISYNLGITALYKIKTKYPGKSTYHVRLNKETESYIFRIIALKEIIEHPRDYGFKPHRTYIAPYKRLIVRNNIPDLHAFARKNNISYYTLKEFNPWLKTNRLDFAFAGNKKFFEIIIPLNAKLENHFIVDEPDNKIDSLQVEPMLPADTTLESSLD